jgi:hypothetical protein
MRFVAALSGAVSLLALAACGGSPSLRAAEGGHFDGLAKSVAASADRGELSASGAVDLARATAKGDVERAQGDAGTRSIQALGACARHVEGALERRAGGRDAIAATAALVLLENNLDSQTYSRSRERFDSADPLWRAVGARGLIDPRGGDTRRKAMADPDERVRLAALSASLQAADATDIEALLEAAKLDPNPLARTRAIRAAGAIGGERVVLALKDLLTFADEPAKQAICDAWATSASLNDGGLQELSLAIDHEKGPTLVAAAHAIIRTAGTARYDEPTTLAAIGVLERAIGEGATYDRVFAILIAPLDRPHVLELVTKAQESEDEVVAIAAMTKRLEATGPGALDAAARKAAIEKLLHFADGTTSVALRAKGALARAKAKEILPMLRRDVLSADARLREEAGIDLASLDDLPHAAIAAVDTDDGVRARVACAILNAR